jgi:hypothetical protein
MSGRWLAAPNGIPDQVKVPPLMLPRCSGRLQLAVTKLPSLKPLLLEKFHSKDDLIDACMASIHIPLFLDGRVAATFRGGLCFKWCKYHLYQLRIGLGRCVPFPHAKYYYSILWLDSNRCCVVAAGLRVIDGCIGWWLSDRLALLQQLPTMLFEIFGQARQPSTMGWPANHQGQQCQASYKLSYKNDRELMHSLYVKSTHSCHSTGSCLSSVIPQGSLCPAAVSPAAGWDACSCGAPSNWRLSCSPAFNLASECTSKAFGHPALVLQAPAAHLDTPTRAQLPGLLLLLQPNGEKQPAA